MVDKMGDYWILVAILTPPPEFEKSPNFCKNFAKITPYPPEVADLGHPCYFVTF